MLIRSVPPLRLPVPSLAAVSPADVAFWMVFAAAAVVFVMDATATIHVSALRPAVVEQNPIARWTLESHPVAPYLLKAAIVAECAVIAAIMRGLGERRAAVIVAALMAVVGFLGIATAVQSLVA
jgi:hypothetical protein